MQSKDLVRRATRVLGDLDQVERHLDMDADSAFRHVVSERSIRHKARAIIGADPEEIQELLEYERQARERLRQSARNAVEKVKAEGEEADLDPSERLATEAIIEVLGRPAILIQDGHFFAPPHPWEELESERAAIERSITSVGRIEVDGHPALDWVGSGFLIADGVVMTNRHVAKEFSWNSGAGWKFEGGMSAFVDFKEEFGSAMQVEFELTKIIGVHDSLDLALFRVEPASDGTLPPPLPVASAGPESTENHRVYVVGYPASDSRRNDPEVMERVFSSIYNVKRLQPGEIRSVRTDAALLTHDCSTLGGNSGSCVIDLGTHKVLGLHFKGRYLESNLAIALWMLQDDALLGRAGIPFAA